MAYLGKQIIPCLLLQATFELPTVILQYLYLWKKLPMMYKVYFYAVDLEHIKQAVGTCSGQSMFRVSALK